MNRISLALASGNSVYLGQVIQLAGLNIKTRVGGLWSNGKTLKSALINADTRTVYRSESAKYYIFIQLSTEMWQFDEDGSVSLEKGTMQRYTTFLPSPAPSSWPDLPEGQNRCIPSSHVS